MKNLCTPRVICGGEDRRGGGGGEVGPQGRPTLRLREEKDEPPRRTPISRTEDSAD
jgi:hypothetical protein